MAAKKLSPQERGAYIVAAANKYHVPWQVLWGVYGVETSHGENVSTSSAGAKGGFQFIEGTAKQYGYPYTNEQTAEVFSKQSDADAHYLSDLYHQKGSWDGALKAYSGGGYGYAQVKKAGGEVPAQKSALQELPGVQPVEEAVEGVEEAGSAAGEFLAVLVNPETWLRVAEGVGGMVLLAMGLKTLTRGSGGGAVAEVGRQVGGAGRIVKRTAEVAAIA